MERTMKLQDVLLKAMAKKISWTEAAEMAGVTDRTMRRIREWYQEFGYTGLFDQGRGKGASVGFRWRSRRKFYGCMESSISTYGLSTRNVGMNMASG
jgi:hypothetical protein